MSDVPRIVPAMLPMPFKSLLRLLVDPKDEPTLPKFRRPLEEETPLEVPLLNPLPNTLPNKLPMGFA